jgi:hypothetical protein
LFWPASRWARRNASDWSRLQTSPCSAHFVGTDHSIGVQEDPQQIMGRSTRLVDASDPATPSRYTASTRRLGLRPTMLADDRISRRSSLSALSVILRLARPEGPRDRWLPSRPMSRDGIWPAGTSLSKLGDRLRRTSLPEVLHRCPLDSCRRYHLIDAF